MAGLNRPASKSALESGPKCGVGWCYEKSCVPSERCIFPQSRRTPGHTQFSVCLSLIENEGKGSGGEIRGALGVKRSGSSRTAFKIL